MENPLSFSTTTATTTSSSSSPRPQRLAIRIACRSPPPPPPETTTTSTAAAKREKQSRGPFSPCWPISSTPPQSRSLSLSLSLSCLLSLPRQRRAHLPSASVPAVFSLPSHPAIRERKRNKGERGGDFARRFLLESSQLGQAPGASEKLIGAEQILTRQLKGPAAREKGGRK